MLVRECYSRWVPLGEYLFRDSFGGKTQSVAECAAKDAPFYPVVVRLGTHRDIDPGTALISYEK
jgi:hypothetical protein